MQVLYGSYLMMWVFYKSTVAFLFSNFETHCTIKSKLLQLLRGFLEKRSYQYASGEVYLGYMWGLCLCGVSGTEGQQWQLKWHTHILTQIIPSLSSCTFSLS